MRLRETTRWTGRIHVAVWNIYGVLTDEESFDNQITTAGHDLLASALGGVDAEIRYLAWGNGTVAPSAADTALGNELGRKVVTTQTSGAAGSGEYVTTTYLGPNDANVQIEELGWFAGASASATAGSGVMVARVLYSRNKTNLESIQVDRTDDVG